MVFIVGVVLSDILMVGIDWLFVCWIELVVDWIFDVVE